MRSRRGVVGEVEVNERGLRSAISDSLHRRLCGEHVAETITDIPGTHDQQQIILMRDVHDLSYEEISDILDLPRGTVKSRLHRARGQLATVLARRLKPEDVI